MAYHIESDQIVDHWIRVFEALSLTSFANFSTRLEFPLLISSELRDIAKAFSISVLTYLGTDVPEELRSVLFVQPEPDPLLQIWNNTLFRLQSLGYADAVYAWGQKIHQLTHQPHISQPSEWDLLLTDWAFDPNDPKWILLSISSGTIEKIQSIIMRYEIYAQEMRSAVRQVQEKPNDLWEEYMFTTLDIGAWINILGQAVIRVEKWSAIFSILSSKELAIFDAWGYNTFIINRASNYFQISDLANRLHLLKS